MALSVAPCENTVMTLGRTKCSICNLPHLCWNNNIYCHSFFFKSNEFIVIVIVSLFANVVIKIIIYFVYLINENILILFFLLPLISNSLKLQLIYGEPSDTRPVKTTFTVKLRNSIYTLTWGYFFSKLLKFWSTNRKCDCISSRLWQMINAVLTAAPSHF